MLRASRRTAACAALLLGALVAGTGPAAADSGGGGGLEECHNNGICVVAQDPGSPGSGSSGGSGSGSGGGQTCSWNGEQVPCTRDGAWFNSSDGCYWKESTPQPPADDPAWLGHDPANGGAVYDRLCYVDGTLGGGQPLWAATAPGAPPPPSPAELAAQAVREIPFHPPTLHTAPGEKGTLLVGLPIWLWYDRDPGTFDHPSATARAGGVAVTARATLKRVEWHMGDSSASTYCDGPGTPYKAEYGSARSPDCGYRYTKSSGGQPDERFTVTATLHWYIEATIDGSGVRPIDPIDDYTVESNLLQLRVAEVQVLN
ncbi:hypothetical protein [Peterkaempfera bronchialis]|uniref:hypothetical protein n=1 Tax=Peterkaempfera bronchialis TaxID=2126346 RepID=UPI003C2B3B04